MKWLRLYNDTPNDPKWRVVAVRSGQPVGHVLAVWMQMLVCANAADERGTLEDWDDETVAAMLGYAPAVVAAIHAAMQGLVLDGEKLTGWDKRQRASDNVAQRVKKHRSSPKGGGSPGNGSANNGHATVTEQTGDVTLHGTDVTLHSADVTTRNVTVTLPPLESVDSSVTRNIPVPAAGDAGARDPVGNQQTDLVAYTVGYRVAEMAGLDPRRCSLVRAEAWLAQGYDPDRDIFPAVRQVMDRHNGQKIHSLKYFDQAIADQRKARTAPMPEGTAANVEHIATARSKRRLGAGAYLERLLENGG